MSEETAGFYTCEQVADLMQVSAHTVMREIQRGRLQAVRVGKQVRIPEGSIHEYMKARRYEAAQEKENPASCCNS